MATDYKPKNNECTACLSQIPHFGAMEDLFYGALY